MTDEQARPIDERISSRNKMIAQRDKRIAKAKSRLMSLLISKEIQEIKESLDLFKVSTYPLERLVCKIDQVYLSLKGTDFKQSNAVPEISRNRQVLNKVFGGEITKQEHDDIYPIRSPDENRGKNE